MKIKIYMFSALMVFLYSAAFAFSPEPVSEATTIDIISESDPFSTVESDPFRPRISKKVTIIERHKEIEKVPPEPIKQEKVIVPLKLKVTGICGNEKMRQAIIEFENSELTVQTGQTVNGKFKIMEITEEAVVIYSMQEERRSIFKLG